MDRMYDELDSMKNNAANSPALCAALTLGQKLLNKYYSLTDDADVYRIAISMSILSQI
jgi:hypothetical protein